MTPSSKRRWLASAALAALLLPSSARAWWVRQEWLGYEAANSFFAFRVADLSVHQSRYGLGVGSSAMRLIGGRAWDVPRRDGSDVSGHGVFTFLPLNLHLTLHSRPGPARVFWGRGARQIRRVELYGSYCPWGMMSNFTRGTRNILGDKERVEVPGSLGVEVLDYGLRADVASWAALSIGQMEFRTPDDGLFRGKHFAKAYVSMDVFFTDFGLTEGDEAGGSVFYLLRDGWYWLSYPFRSDKVTEPF